MPISRELKLAKGVEACLDYYRDIGQRRMSLAYDIDGVVFKVNRIAFQHLLLAGRAAQAFGGHVQHLLKLRQFVEQV